MNFGNLVFFFGQIEIPWVEYFEWVHQDLLVRWNLDYLQASIHFHIVQLLHEEERSLHYVARQIRVDSDSGCPVHSLPMIQQMGAP